MCAANGEIDKSVMTGQIFTVHVYYVLLCSTAVLSSENAGDFRVILDSGNCTEELDTFQMETVRAIKTIFREQQACVPSQRYEDKVKIEWLEAKAKRLERRSKDLTAATTALASQKKNAHVPNPLLIASPGASVTLTCESQRQRLSVCLWEWTVNGQRRAITVDDEALWDGNHTPVAVDGIIPIGNALSAGKCGLNIRSLTANHFGLWTCTLVSEAGEIFTGDVGITKDNRGSINSRNDPKFYFVTWKGNLQTRELGASSASTLYRSPHGFRGVAYDFMNDRIYWSRKFGIYRGDLHGNEVTEVYATERYGTLSGLAFDWVQVKIFVATYGGYILACDARPTQRFPCVEILSGLGWFHGIVIDPFERSMYWTVAYNGGGIIMKAGLDGSKAAKIVTGLLDPYGIAIDFSGRRLYWADEDTHMIQSSYLDGRDNKAVVELPSGSKPVGMAVIGDRIYWGDWGSGKLQSSTKSGYDIKTHVRGEGADKIAHLAIVADVKVLLGQRGTRVSGQD